MEVERSDYPLFTPSMDWEWAPMSSAALDVSCSPKDPGDFDFGLSSSVMMIDADEIFQNGRMLPSSGLLRQQRPRVRHVQVAAAAPSPSPSSAAAVPQMLRRHNSMPAARAPPPSSITCSSRWKEIFKRLAGGSSGVDTQKHKRKKETKVCCSSSSSSPSCCSSQEIISDWHCSSRRSLLPRSGSIDEDSSSQQRPRRIDKKKATPPLPRAPPRRSVSLDARELSRVYPLRQSSSLELQRQPVRVTPVLNMPVCIADSKFDILRRRKGGSQTNMPPIQKTLN